MSYKRLQFNGAGHRGYDGLLCAWVGVHSHHGETASREHGAVNSLIVDLPGQDVCMRQAPCQYALRMRDRGPIIQYFAIRIFATRAQESAQITDHSAQLCTIVHQTVNFSLLHLRPTKVGNGCGLPGACACSAVQRAATESTQMRRI